MRYLKVFGLVICAAIIFQLAFMGIAHVVSGKNNEKTLDNSSIIQMTDDRYLDELLSMEERSKSTVTVEPEITPTPEPIGVEKYVPPGSGAVHTFMGWQLVTSKSSKQYKLKQSAGENYDENGFGIINGRYVVATKPYYGTIGDYLDVYKSNGEIIKCIVGDQKGSDGGGDKYSHSDGSIIEFAVDKYRWYKKYNGIGRYRRVYEYHPEWNCQITKIVNIGNYWD